MIAAVWRTTGASIRELFLSADPDLTERTSFLKAVASWLRARPDVIEQWSGYSDDKRSSPSPYFRFDGGRDEHATHEVGFFDAHEGYLDVRQYVDAAAACADFLYREATWALRRERVT